MDETIVVRRARADTDAAKTYNVRRRNRGSQGGMTLFTLEQAEALLPQLREELAAMQRSDQEAGGGKRDAGDEVRRPVDPRGERRIAARAPRGRA